MTKKFSCASVLGDHHSCLHFFERKTNLTLIRDEGGSFWQEGQVCDIQNGNSWEQHHLTLLPDWRWFTAVLYVSLPRNCDRDSLSVAVVCLWRRWWWWCGLVTTTVFLHLVRVRERLVLRGNVLVINAEKISAFGQSPTLFTFRVRLVLPLYCPRWWPVVKSSQTDGDRRVLVPC